MRAGIVVTGTEVLTGRVADRNGPWLAEELRRHGIDVSHTIVVGDRPDDLRSALRFLASVSVDLVITSGGLGPTADDLTADVVASHQGRAVALDHALAARIGEIVERLSAGRGWRTHAEATAAAVRKQAHVPVGAAVLEPVGTAPGLVVPVAEGRSGPPVLVLPGPPRELQQMWPAVLAEPSLQSLFAHNDAVHQRTMRLWGTPESELAATLRAAGDTLDGLEITTCLRDGGELEIVTRYAPTAQPAYDALRDAIASTYADTLFSPDGETIDDLVAEALLERGLTIACAESCTGGLLSGRLTARAGSSAYVLGGLVTYSNEAKQHLLGVPSELLDTVGAVSSEVAEAMSTGVRANLGTDVGVGITGVAGPGGGSDDKPVGLVYLSVANEHRVSTRRVVFPGDRGEVRARSVTLAMHMIRRLLRDAE